MDNINKPLKLDGAENIRELGGYRTQFGGKTKEKVYLRSDRTNKLTNNDMEKLIDYGVTMVVDLRSEIETEKNPSVFSNIEGINYKNIPMLDGFASMVKGVELPSSMFELYKDLLDNGKNNFRNIFKGFLENEGVTLFNCTAGKDRTGVVSMLILQLAGVADETIIKDYGESEKNLTDFIKKQKIFFKSIKEVEVPEYFLYSKEEDMRKTLDYLYKNYQDTRNYLKESGLTEKELDRLNKKFIEC